MILNRNPQKAFDSVDQASFFSFCICIDKVCFYQVTNCDWCISTFFFRDVIFDCTCKIKNPRCKLIGETQNPQQLERISLLLTAYLSLCNSFLYLLWNVRSKVTNQANDLNEITRWTVYSMVAPLSQTKSLATVWYLQALHRSTTGKNIPIRTYLQQRFIRGFMRFWIFTDRTMPGISDSPLC